MALLYMTGMSEASRQLIRRCIGVAVLAENVEAQIARGGPIDLAEQCAISSILVRLATRLGINRAAKLVTPLRDYLPRQLPKFGKVRDEQDKIRVSPVFRIPPLCGITRPAAVE